MRTTTTIPIAIASTLLVGCFTYQPQPGEATARLRFVTYSKDTSSISVRDTDACPKERTIANQQASGPFSISTSTMKIGKPGAVDEGGMDSLELVIPAEKTALMISGSFKTPAAYMPGYNCHVGVAFLPKKGRDYELQYRYEGTRCRARLLELVTTADSRVEKVPEPTVRYFDAREKPCDYR